MKDNEKHVHLARGDLPYHVSDMLADLMHWCDAHDIPFATCLGRARDHYAVETTDPEEIASASEPFDWPEEYGHE